MTKSKTRKVRMQGNISAKGKFVSNSKPQDKLRMKMVLDKWKANGHKSMKKAMLEVGYGPTMEPRHIMKSKSWKELMEELMPDDLLMKRHTELLNARRTEVVRDNKYVENEDGEMEKVKGYKIVDLGPDVTAVSKGLQMAYKLKGVFNKQEDPEAAGPRRSTIYNLFYKPEIRDSVKQLEKALTKQLYGEPLKDDDGTVPENFGGFSTQPGGVATDITPGGDIDEGNTGEDGVVEESTRAS